MPMHSPAHPGAQIKEELDFLEISTAKAAEALGVTRQQLHRVIAGTSAITAEMAVRLETVLGGPDADHWTRLQAAYDLAQARKRKAEITKGLRRLNPVS